MESASATRGAHRSLVDDPRLSSYTGQWEPSNWAGRFTLLSHGLRGPSLPALIAPAPTICEPCCSLSLHKLHTHAQHSLTEGPAPHAQLCQLSSTHCPFTHSSHISHSRAWAGSDGWLGLVGAVIVPLANSNAFLSEGNLDLESLSKCVPIFSLVCSLLLRLLAGFSSRGRHCRLSCGATALVVEGSGLAQATSLQHAAP